MLWAAMEGATNAASNAGVPTTSAELRDWISGRALPPRASEGLNDPLSVTAVLFYHLSALRANHDPVSVASTRLLATILDDRKEAEEWGQDDLVRYGTFWRKLVREAEHLILSPSLSSIASAIASLLAFCDAYRSDDSVSFATPDGRLLQLAPVTGRIWLASLLVPDLFRRSGLSSPLPFLVPRLKFASVSPAELEGELHRLLHTGCRRALDELDRLEQSFAVISKGGGTTSRSRLPAVAEILQVFPGLTTARLARAFDMTVPGAAHLQREFKRRMSRIG